MEAKPALLILHSMLSDYTPNQGETLTSLKKLKKNLQ